MSYSSFKDGFSDLPDFDEENPDLSRLLAARIVPSDLSENEDFWKDPKLGVSQSGIELNPEQAKCVRGTEQALRAGHSRLYIEAPTGWGKTVMAMKLLECLRSGHKPPQVLIIANDVGDLWRWRDEFEKHDPVLGKPGYSSLIHVGVYYGEEKNIKPVTITTYASAVNLIRQRIIDKDKLELIILDEGHKSLSDLRQEVLGGVKCVQLALSATPAYTREKSLEGGSVCAYECSPKKAEELGLIAPFQQVVIIQPKVVLNSDVILTTGAFDTKRLGGQFKEAHVTQSFINFYKTWKDQDGNPVLGRQGIINCLSVEHADEVAKEINEAFKDDFKGIIPAIALNGKTPKKLRQWAINEYKAGRVLALCGDELFVHGFDAPNVDFVFNMSPSTSGVKVGQRGGRARRIDRTGSNPNKTAIIVDILFENVSPKGWQLLYSEWMNARLFEKGEDFFELSSAGSSGKQPKKEIDVDWQKVPADTILDKPEDLESLIAWREQRLVDFRKGPLWTERFPRLWKEIQKSGINTIEGLTERAREFDAEVSTNSVTSILKGVTRHFKPDGYIDNWHPVCLALSKVFRVHVNQLFPIPDNWEGPRINTPERREYLQYRANVAKLAEQNGFSSLTDLAKYLRAS